jgi:hypothetical protein
MAFWAVAQLQPQRQALALPLLEQKQFPVYAPRLRERRTVRGRREDIEAPLFPGYAFVARKGIWRSMPACPRVSGSLTRPAGVAGVALLRQAEVGEGEAKPSTRLRIWGSAVRIRPGAPISH